MSEFIEEIKGDNNEDNIIIIGFFLEEKEYEEKEYEEYDKKFLIGSMNGEISMITFYRYSSECPRFQVLEFHVGFNITKIEPENIDSIFSKIKYYANEHISIDISSLCTGYFKSDVILFSDNGDDYHYPNGKFFLNESYFSSIKVNKVNFNESIKDEFLNKLFNPDRLEQLSIFCNKDLEYLGRSIISSKDIIECF